MTLNNQRIALYCFVGLGLVVWYILWQLLASVMELVLPGEYLFGMPLSNYLSFLAIAIAGVAGVIIWRNERANRFSNEVIVELKKVTWPSWKELRGSTIVVGITTMIISLILWVFDKILETAMRFFL